jgi:hypothetical protein
MTDIKRAHDFMQTHARQLDRRRFDLVTGNGEAEGTLAALSAYRNPDGGFGWGLEADLRDPGSQPGGALHAFEVLREVGPVTSPMGAQLCDWLESASLPDGGLPFALPGATGPGTAPWWAGADTSASSLHITSAVCGEALRAAEHDEAVAGHPWTARAAEFCVRGVAALDEAPMAVAFRFILDFLDTAVARGAAPAAELERLAAWIPPSGTIPVVGGAEGEAIKPLELSPEPGTPLRELMDPAVIEADLERLAGEQREDGGWEVDFDSASPAGALEWRGYMTVWAVAILTDHGG